MAAGLVAFCWDTLLKPDAVATGELTLTGEDSRRGRRRKGRESRRRRVTTTTMNKQQDQKRWLTKPMPV